MKNEMFSEYNDVVSIKDLQHMLHIGRNTAYDLIRSGRIKTAKIGTRYIIPKQSVINFLNLA